jgi:hypothetical protein
MIRMTESGAAALAQNANNLPMLLFTTMATLWNAND